MSILSKTEILDEVAAGNIIINPFNPELVGPASVDLRLSSVFRVFKDIGRDILVNDEVDFRMTTERVEVKDYLLLMPGKTVLGMTLEKIKLSPSICGWLEGRSKFARVGLLVHISASFIHPGIENHQVLELSNFGASPLKLYPKTRICQFVFQRMDGQAIYEGTFKLQSPENF